MVASILRAPFPSFAFKVQSVRCWPAQALSWCQSPSSASASTWTNSLYFFWVFLGRLCGLAEPPGLVMGAVARGWPGWPGSAGGCWGPQRGLVLLGRALGKVSAATAWVWPVLALGPWFLGHDLLLMVRAEDRVPSAIRHFCFGRAQRQAGTGPMCFAPSPADIPCEEHRSCLV